MAMTRAITLLLLSFALNKAYCTPVPQCASAPAAGPVGSPNGGSAPAPIGSPNAIQGPQPEVYNQNNGNPLVVVAKDQPQSSPSSPSCGGSGSAPGSSFGSSSLYGSQPSYAPSGSNYAPSSGVSNPEYLNSQPASAADLNSLGSLGGSPVAPGSSPSCPGNAPSASQDEINISHQLADQSIAESALETIPAPNKPCKEETATEVVQHPGETFVHQPGEILINQPPTRLIINHPPYIVRPSPIVVNSGARTVTNAYTRKILPSTIQLRPVIVRVVKPIERKVLLDKPSPQPGTQTFSDNPQVPDQCSNTQSATSSLSNSFGPAGVYSSGPASSGSVGASQPAYGSALPTYASPAQGYPGCASSGYPSDFAPSYGSGSPSYGAYPSGGYQSAGYPSGAYPSGAYPSAGCPSAGYPGGFGSSASGSSGLPDLSPYLQPSPLASESDAEISTDCGAASAPLSAPSSGFGSSAPGYGSSGAQPASAADLSSLISISANSIANPGSYGSGAGCV